MKSDKIDKRLDEVSLAISDIRAKIVVSIVIGFIVAIIAALVVEPAKLYLAFIGAMIGSLISIVSMKETRENIKIIWKRDSDSSKNHEMDKKSMFTFLEPTPEERAYSLGWHAFFDLTTEASNPYDSKLEMELFEKWEEGRRSAEITNESIPNV